MTSKRFTFFLFFLSFLLLPVSPQVHDKLRQNKELDVLLSNIHSQSGVKNRTKGEEGKRGEIDDEGDIIMNGEEGKGEEEGREVEVIFLGTGAAIPSLFRNVSCVYFHWTKVGGEGGEGREGEGRGGVMMDCGEGTVGQLWRRFGEDYLGSVFFSSFLLESCFYFNFFLIITSPPTATFLTLNVYLFLISTPITTSVSSMSSPFELLPHPIPPLPLPLPFL